MFETNTCRSRNHVFPTVSPSLPLSLHLFPPTNPQKLTNNLSKQIRRHQRPNLLQPDPLPNNGPNPPPPTPHVRNPQHHPTPRRPHLPLDHGQTRPKTSPPGGQRSHVSLPPNHHHPRSPLLFRLDLSSPARLGICCHVTFLHACLWSHVGSCAVGFARGSFSYFVEGQGRGVVDL